MTWNRVNLTLAALLLLVCASILLGQSDLSRPNFEFLPDMKYSPAYGAYAPNPNFANGQTLQPPVPGTLARGETPLHFRATPEDAKRAGEELALPALKSEKEVAKALRRGEAVYRTICLACHGPQGAGDGTVVARGFPPPPSLLTGNSIDMRDGQLFHILTFGQKNMPGFASRLTPENRWDVIRHVRKMQKDQPQATAAPEEPGKAKDAKDQKNDNDQAEPPADPKEKNPEERQETASESPAESKEPQDAAPASEPAAASGSSGDEPPPENHDSQE